MGRVLLYSEDGGSTFLRNSCVLFPKINDFIMSQKRNFEFRSSVYAAGNQVYVEDVFAVDRFYCVLS